MPSKVDVARWSRPFWWACQLMLAVMLVAACAWSCSYAPASLFRWINAFTAYFYLPAYAILLVASLNRRQVLTAIAGLLVAWHMSVVLPSVISPNWLSEPDRSPGAIEEASIRVFYASVGKANQKYEELFEEIRQSEADVLVLTEFTEAWYDKFNSTELPADFPNHIHLSEYDAAATGVFSRLPLTEDDRVYQAKRVVVKATVDVYGQELAILAIHAPRPVRSPLHKYEEFWGILLEELEAERANGHMLLIGDYNATPYSLIYRTLTTEYGLQDSHVTSGRGIATTWPNGTELLPPIRIDHAMLTPGVTCLGIREGVGAGTDHKPLILDLAIPGERLRESGSPAPASTEQTLAATRY